jgi:hypothetical protein
MKSWCRNRTKRQALKSQGGGHVRFTPKADMRSAARDACSGPEADIRYALVRPECRSQTIEAL